MTTFTPPLEGKVAVVSRYRRRFRHAAIDRRTLRLVSDRDKGSNRRLPTAERSIGAEAPLH